jgi:hypothetical protein
VGTGIFDKKVTSANDYRAPMAIGSGFNAANLNILGSDYGQNIMLQSSGVGPRDFTSGILGGMSGYVSNPQNPMSGLSGTNFGYSQASSNAIDARNFALGRSQAFGNAVGDLSNRVGGALDNWWNSKDNNFAQSASSPYAFGSGGYTGQGPFMP